MHYTKNVVCLECMTLTEMTWLLPYTMVFLHYSTEDRKVVVLLYQIPVVQEK